MFKTLLVAASVLALAACGGPYALNQQEMQTVELGARQFTERTGGSFTGCSGQDSDGDSYVTCTYTKDGQPQSLLCSYKASAAGCKSANKR